MPTFVRLTIKLIVFHKRSLGAVFMGLLLTLRKSAERRTFF